MCPSTGDVDDVGDCVYVCGVRVLQEISVPTSQFFYDPKSALRKKFLVLKKLSQIN